MSRTRTSAGILLYRVVRGELEVFLAHPGGPLFARKDEGYWTIPKGETEDGEDLLACAQREFTEETGLVAPAPFQPLGDIRQKGGKVVHAWAAQWPAERSVPPVRSSLFEMEWPPRSGRMGQFPEVDRAEFMGLPVAQRRLKEAQWPLVERLVVAGWWRPQAPG